MATKLLDGFRYVDKYSAINGDTSGLVVVSSPTVDGNGALQFQRSATTEDSAGIKRSFTPFLDVSKYAALNVYAYIEAADLADIKYFDIIANSGVLEPYQTYDAQYECTVLPASFPTFPFTKIAAGTNSEAINSGVLELTCGPGAVSDYVYYNRDMSIDWFTPASDGWVYVNHRCKMPVGAPTTSGASFALIETNYRGSLLDLELGDGLIRWNSGAGSYAVDTTSDFIDIEMFIRESPREFILLINGDLAAAGTAPFSATSWLRFGIQPHNPGFAGMAEWEHIRWCQLGVNASYAVYRFQKSEFVDVNGDPFAGDAWVMFRFNPALPTFQLGTPDLGEVDEYGYRTIFPAHSATPEILIDSLEAEVPVLFYEEPIVAGTWEIDNEVIEPFSGTVIDSLNDISAWASSGGAGALSLDGSYTLVGGSAILVPKLAGYDAALISRTLPAAQSFGDYDYAQAEFYIDSSELALLRGIFLYLCNDVSNYAVYYFGNNIFDTFEAITPWTPDVNAAVALDTTHVIEGSRSVKLTNVSAGAAVYTGASRTYDPFALYAPVYYTFYLTPTEAASLSNFRVTFTDAGGTTSWEFSSFAAGWNSFEINATNFTSQTGSPTLINITQVDLEIKTSITGISIYLDNARFSIPWNNVEAGWNRGFFKVKEPIYTVGTVDYTDFDLVYLKYSTFQEDAISTFRWDSLSRFDDLIIDNATKIHIDYSDYVNGPSSFKFDKLFGELYGGILRDYSVRRDYSVLDKLSAHFKISEDDLSRVDKFRVVLDETDKHEKLRAFAPWTNNYSGDLPSDVYTNLMEDFETLGDFNAGGGVTLSANTTQKTEGTQSVQADYALTSGDATTDKIYSPGIDFTGQTAVDFYIPAGMVGNINSVSIQLWEGGNYSQYDYALSLTSGWQALAFDPENPDYESGAGLTRLGVTKVVWLYNVSAAVTGFCWDNMRMSEWRLVFP